MPQHGKESQRKEVQQEEHDDVLADGGETDRKGEVAMKMISRRQVETSGSSSAHEARAKNEQDRGFPYFLAQPME
jgi:hypothetical protein